MAVTGACGMLGSALIRQLEADRRYYKVLAIDLRKPSFPLSKTQFHRIDLTLPGADAQIASLLRAEGADTFVHLAFLSNFTHRSTWAHELESIGTMQVLNACTESRTGKFVLWGQSLCYGANPQNPAYLREEHEQICASGPNDTFFSDKIDAERQTRQFAEEHPGRVVTVLRMAPIVAPDSRNFISRMLSSRYIPVLFGYDPLLQFLHLDDGTRALKLVIDEDYPGVFNIAADGVLPLRTITGLLGRVPLPVPVSMARHVAGFLWMGQVIDVPPSFLNFLRYPCVMDTERARRKLRYFPEHDIHEILAELAGRVESTEATA
ncbi:MAG: NAD-dependent epimerase/dehydratase family protein [bacterium]